MQQNRDRFVSLVAFLNSNITPNYITKLVASFSALCWWAESLAYTLRTNWSLCPKDPETWHYSLSSRLLWCNGALIYTWVPIMASLLIADCKTLHNSVYTLQMHWFSRLCGARNPDIIQSPPRDQILASIVGTHCFHAPLDTCHAFTYFWSILAVVA